MAADLHTCDHADEDYIDIEVSSNSNFFCHAITSPSHPREFEFQMFSSSLERETTTSPADELFYKGKLLPLHLPPRLQMVEKLIQNSNSYDQKTDSFDESFSTPLTTTTYNTPTANSPFESCNISPSESCQASGELNQDEYFFGYATEAGSFTIENPNKSWTRKLKLIKQSTIGSTLKASRAYLKSLFTKSGCSDESSFNKEKIAADGSAHHRRSVSGVNKWLSTSKSSCSSSSSLSNSNGFRESHFPKRSSSVSPDIESSIQGAIAHCKKSQQQFHSRKTTSEVGYYSSSASRVVREDQER